MNARHTRQRGMSLVELMVGMAIGLLIVAAGLLAFMHHVRESRSLLVEARLMQDLRTAADLMARNLRRAGHWGAAQHGVWRAPATDPQPNPHAAVQSGEEIAFSYSRGDDKDHGVDSNEPFAYRLRKGVIELRIGDGSWQALTDAGTVTVSSLQVTPSVHEIVLDGFCSTACPADSPSSTCPPRQQVRSFALEINAHAAGNTSVQRTLHAGVHVRNDAVIGACPV